MNTNLYGKTILIGREQDQGRLYVCLIVGGQPYSFPLGLPQSVPNTVSRCQPKEGKAHCSISIDGKGRMLLTNLKSQNVTFVDGCEVLKKYIDESTCVTLGCNQYSIDINAILDTASKIVKKIGEDNRTDYRKEFAGIRQAYIDYQREITEIKNNASRKANLPKIMATLVPAIIGLIFVLASEDITMRIISMSVGSVLSGLVGVITLGKSGSVNEEITEKITEIQIKYQPNYSCPKCGMKYPFSTHWKKIQAEGKCLNPKCNARFF